MGGAQRPFGLLMSPKDGCAQRTGAHARPKPTSNMINKYDHKRAVALSRIFYKTGIFAGFPLHNINFGERNSEAAMGRVGRGEHFIS
jgi:hypothetical protein